jgi:DnaA family protein
MRQRALDISPPPQPTLDNFVPGPNAELIARLREFREGAFPEVVLYVWGEKGSGKSHLMRACDGMDDVQTLGEAAQIALFNRINDARQNSGRVLAAGNAPPAQLPLREDLRTRLGWGHVFHLQVLGESERRAVLRQAADSRGVMLSDEVLDYMLHRFSRDLGSLMELLAQLDGYALQTQRAITIPLIRSMLENE